MEIGNINKRVEKGRQFFIKKGLNVDPILTGMVIALAGETAAKSDLSVDALQKHLDEAATQEREHRKFQAS